MAKDGVKVCLSGEGADEIYCGYSSWRLFLKLARFQFLLPRLSRLIFSCAKGILSLPLLTNYRFLYLRDIVWRGLNSVNLFWGGSWDFCSSDIGNLLNIGNRDVLETIELKKIRPEWGSFRRLALNSDQSGWMSFFDMRSRLPELLLNRLDKQFMAHSIESRVPYLDHLSVQAYFALPAIVRHKQIKKGKDFLRNVVNEILNDPKLSSTRKRGFQAPVSNWVQSSFGALSKAIVINFSNRTGLFNESAVLEIFDRGTRHYFSLLFFVIWYCNFIDDVLPEYDLTFQPRKLI